MTQKNPKKWRCFHKDVFFSDNKKAYFEKRATIGASPRDKLSNKKKYLASYCTGGAQCWRYSVETKF
jgi:predicted sulfurtransferase